MNSSRFIALHTSNGLVGIVAAAVLGLVIGWVWPGMGIPGFLTFLLFWVLETVNRIPLERRHPELITSPAWKHVRLKYKPLRLGEGEYEITLIEFIRGQIAMIVLGLPIALLLGGLIGVVWPASRWPVFLFVFGAWAATMLMGVVSAIQKE